MKTKRFFSLALMSASTVFCFAQNFEPTMPLGKQFLIQSALNYGKDNGGYWDIPGKPEHIVKAANIQVWELDAGMDRKFALANSPEEGYFEIVVGNSAGSRIEIDGGKPTKGSNINVWGKNDSEDQRFGFEHLGNGRFKIYTKKGHVITLAGASSKNGSNVQIAQNSDNPSREWYLVDVNSKKAFIPAPRPAEKVYDVKDIILYQHQSIVEDSFEKISAAALKSKGENIVTEAFSEFNDDEKFTRIVYVLNGVRKNKSVDVRRSVYTQLAAVTYGKAKMAQRMLLNAYFDKFNDTQLSNEVQTLQSKVVQ